MSQDDRLLAQGEALTRFRVSVAKEERFAEFYTGELFDEGIRHASGPQDRSFCRRVFCHTHAQRVVDASMALPLPYIAVSDADDIVSFSGFRSLPFHVQRWLATDLMAPQDGEYAFRLGTCGGVRLWCSAHLAACFTPLTRNEMQFLDIRLTLHKGKNSVLIHLDELFERDTVCALKMVYLGEKPLRVGTIKGQQLAPTRHGGRRRHRRPSRALRAGSSLYSGSCPWHRRCRRRRRGRPAGREVHSRLLPRRWQRSRCRALRRRG